ncbi:MAG: 16S rRNA (cytidine(1402)-2'-O)-methyltransferase [Acidobacteria bacterium]|nr:16S rRNA (cytidine(1402)-2'-O)-methyltransferase [Acidobacteriota bacterium]
MVAAVLVGLPVHVDAHVVVRDLLDRADVAAFEVGRDGEGEQQQRQHAATIARVSSSAAGALYLVATPIGNLEDITLRALRVLRECDLIACEDTRRTRQLLTHFEIHGKPLVSYHEHNEAERAAELVERVRGGAKVALASDAGTPAVSDPGYRVVQAAVAAGLEVVPIPGPVAAVTALAASGLPTDAFCFRGFPPAKQGQRRSLFESCRDEPATLVFYEAPHRIVASLRDLLATLGDRPVAVARELTKLHEEFLRGSASEVLATLEARDRVKGEIVLLVGRGEASAAAPELPLEQRVQELIDGGASHMDALKQAARERGLSKREAYRLLEGSK